MNGQNKTSPQGMGTVCLRSIFLSGGRRLLRAPDGIPPNIKFGLLSAIL